MSVDFGGTINQAGFDDITIGSDTPGGPGIIDTAPVPTMSTWALIVLALLMFGVAARRFRKSS